MTFIEALKTGLPMRRTNWTRVLWCEYVCNGLFIEEKSLDKYVNITKTDMLSNDWEVKRSPIILNDVYWRDTITPLGMIIYPNKCSNDDPISLSNFVGKKTKVTIEVIE